MHINHDDASAAELQAFRDSARDLLARLSPQERLRKLRGSLPGFDRAAWTTLAEAGWPAIVVPEAAGGLGLGLEYAAAVMEETGRALPPEPVLAGALLPSLLLSAVPVGGQRERLLAGLLDGSLVPAVAWQESSGLEDLEACATTAQREGDTWLLHGTKRWVTPAAPDGWLVSAQDAEEPVLLWLPAGTTGATEQVQARIDGSAMATLQLDGVRLPADAELARGEPARLALAEALDAARLLQSAELLGLARMAFDTTLDYLKNRVQFGKPIGSNQALQHRMVDAYLQLELADAGLRQALADARDRATLPLAASRAKARCAEAALHITRLAIQFHGAMGYTDECAVGLYAKRAMQLAGWLGNAPAHRARFMLLGGPASAAVGDRLPDATEFPRDADWAAMDEAQFRATVRGFFRTHYPAELRNVPRRLHWNELRDWYMTLSRQGWLAPSWPREHGGMALPPDKMVAFIEEQEDHGLARMPDQGLINLGPLLISFGTDEQKRRWLPPILNGEHVWCQGYSEPNAGSDLASLRTEAVADGDDFVVTGQKIWTTLAQDATHIFLLVRTGKFARRQEGISFLLADLSTPGVTVRPIRNIAGEEEFCEVFFDQVRVPQANLVGELHKGWHLAKALLGHERIFVGSPKTPQHALGQLRQLALATGRMADPAFAAQFAQLQLDLADLRALYGRFADIVKRGDELPPSVSLLKIWATETYTRIGITLMETAGDDGAAAGPADFEGTSLYALGSLMNAFVTTIYGGTNEIQRNIISRQVLDLPG
jgi:alkylation response protein AidB-like acyl-CoA dehydrogenase